MKPSLIASLLALLCTACAISTVQTLPKLDLPRTQNPLSLADPGEASFNDPVLNALISQALQHNASLAIAVANMDEVCAMARP
ncbi:hypothetical protein HA050_05640 [Iodobacter sp. HSC-16F04]|uniref:Uncharacterized protein n=1 Tax=Iodobacter violaceini TaxID=3044271 RepID=A0ABX0KN22_9NEIS|nr:hypothetical protein [Iodobacter violacea]NHQ85600.1 hypothetical protein [Iodobacter violacea]